MGKKKRLSSQLIKLRRRLINWGKILKELTRHKKKKSRQKLKKVIRRGKIKIMRKVKIYYKEEKQI